MAAFDIATVPPVHKVLGTLTNSMKVVETVVTVTGVNNGTDTPITIDPLVRVIKFIAGSKTIATGGIMAYSAHATLLNKINMKPAASADTDKFAIISFGY
jgi:hypothetical protein